MALSVRIHRPPPQAEVRQTFDLKGSLDRTGVSLTATVTNGTQSVTHLLHNAGTSWSIAFTVNWTGDSSARVSASHPVYGLGNAGIEIRVRA